MAGDLRLRRHGHQVFAGKLQRLFDEAGDAQLVIGKVGGRHLLVILIVRRGDAVRMLRLFDVGLRVFRRKRVAAAEKALDAVGQVIGLFDNAARRAVALVQPVKNIAARERQRRCAEACMGQKLAAVQLEFGHVNGPFRFQHRPGTSR